MFEVIALAIALSMDAFAVSIGLGAKSTTKIKSLALISAVYFGLFQALMPLIGYAAGIGLLGWFEAYASGISFILLLLIATKMIYESFLDDAHSVVAKITHKLMLILAIATSIDAMAAGFTLTVLDVNPYIACAIIGVTTFVFSWVGVLVGAKSGNWLGSKAELFGGVILILIGLRMLLF